MSDIKEIISLLNNPSKEDIELLQKAYDFAHKAHEFHIRKSGEQYFNHLFATAKNIAELQMSATTVSAGFLHDLLEDTNTKPEDTGKKLAEK